MRRSSAASWSLGFGAVASGTAAVALSPGVAQPLTATFLLIGVAVAVALVMHQTAPTLRTPDLSGSAPADGRPSRRGYVVPVELRPLGLMVGRTAEVAGILDYLRVRGIGGPRVVLISGPAGIGKTTLATHLAHQVADWYDHGSLFASLAGIPAGSGADRLRPVFTALVEALSGPGELLAAPLPDLEERYRALSSARPRLLIILDDVPDAQAVRALRPAGRGGAVLVTSRRDLPELDPYLSVPLGSLPDEASVELLAAIVGPDRIGHKDRDEAQAVREIVQTAGGHPLALQLAASALANRRHWTLSSAVRNMTTGGRSDCGVLDLSYALLPREDRKALVFLGLLDRDTFAPWMLAALVNTDAASAWRTCERLAHARMLEYVTDSTGVAALRILERVHDYAHARMSAELSEQERAEALARLQRWERERRQSDPEEILRQKVYPELDRGRVLIALGHARGALARCRENPAAGESAKVREDQGLALAALAEILAELGQTQDARGLVCQALATDATRARPRALRTLAKLQRRQRRLTDAQTSLRDALAAAEAIADRSERIRVWRDIAIAYGQARNRDQGLNAAEEAFGVCAERTDAGGRHRASLLFAKGLVLYYAADRADERRADLWPDGWRADPADPDLTEAEHCLTAAAEVAVEHDQRLWVGWIGYLRARVAGQHEHFDHCRVLAFQAAEEFGRMRHRYGTARCHLVAGESLMAQHRPAEALPLLEESLKTFNMCDDMWMAARTAVVLAEANRSTGHAAEAAALARNAADVFDRMGDGASARAARDRLADAEVIPLGAGGLLR